jgi:multiple antibiotic resistance protein
VKEIAQAIRVYSTDPYVLEIAKSILLMVSALFPIVNPIGGSPVFLLLTLEYSKESRKLLARRVAINSFILLIVSMVVGTHILSFFGISLPVVQVGGGLIVASTGWAMLTRSDQVDRGQVHQTVTTQDIFKNAFYPLTLPLTVGPGSISIAITLGANEPRHLGANVLALISPAIGAALIAVTIYICYGYSARLAAAVGPNGMNVILRLSSFLLVCIGVQILWNGVSALVKTLNA